MSETHNQPRIIHGALLTRRRFLTGSGAMVVSVAVLPGLASAATNPKSPPDKVGLDASRPASWIEIHADNSVVIRTGKCDFGQGSIYTAYPQIIAEELEVSLSSIKHVVSGDTDRTPDGGGTFGLLRTNVLNLRKVAAYTREALLDIAAAQWSVPRTSLAVKDGVISGGGKQLTYGDMVAGQALQLTIPVSGELVSFRGLVVEGEPPLKDASQYKIIGQSVPNPIIAEKVSARTTWVADVKLPGMLHGRVIHPRTLGSKLLAAGKLDRKTHPTARTVVVGNLLGVVAQSEWETIQAARQVASGTRWSDWEGLPGSDGLHQYLREQARWDPVPVTESTHNRGNPRAAFDGAPHVLSCSSELPYHKHAPIGPSMALADVAADGRITVHTHTQNPQFLRSHLALMLGISPTKVIIRTYPGPGHYGRSNGGNAGAEAEAVLLSREVGQPVRLHWMRADDLQWSTQSAPAYADVRIAVDKNGKISAYEADHYGPPMQDDRPIGALLAGLPTIDAPVPNHKNPEPVQGMANFMADGWVYSAVENVAERAHSTWQIGQQQSPLDVGLRDHSMRTPTQFQQNFPREVAISEAASLVGMDALAFRILNTQDRRLKNLLTRLRSESGWQERPSPRPDAKASGSTPQPGRGVSVMFRGNGYWVSACEVSVVPDTGLVSVDRVTVVVDTGVVVNPMQLKRQVQAGALMGVSQAMYEEVSFDKSAVTDSDWISYPILKMGDMPQLNVVLAPDPETTIYGQGSEGANALLPSAIAAAVFDATGKSIRRLPMQPDNVKTMLQS
ncbi:MAG: xanthine dehydrogenase family protein molybdopterin-binding subunit [Ketobacter sp.]|nr:MAG: xanthine dehydrogenase family protein molybdopterin-binding subunit [Ketobacter sp.]